MTKKKKKNSKPKLDCSNIRRDQKHFNPVAGINYIEQLYDTSGQQDAVAGLSHTGKPLNTERAIIECWF